MPSDKNKKRKKSLDDVTVTPKRQQQQSILHYCVQKRSDVIITQSSTTSCPICAIPLESLTEIQIQSHVNSCLDCGDTEDADTCEGSAFGNVTEITDPVETNAANTPKTVRVASNLTPSASNGSASINNNNKTSWANLFSKASYKIRGIWSMAKKDIAPGMTESEISWFGEPKSNDPTVKKKRSLPYYKRLAGTNMVVDAFTFGEIPGCEGYLLSHFHSDHYMGLNASWVHGPIYCSEITARLLETKLGVAPDFIHALPMEKPCLLSGKDNLTVTLIDANHCPGAVLFLVEHQNLKYLHTGDFRANAQMCLNLQRYGPLDIVYLDTTYLNPKYSFPPQESCIKAACDLAKRHNNVATGTITVEDLSATNSKKINHWFTQDKIISPSDIKNDDMKRLVVVVGTYSLGKERIFIDVAKSLNSKIFVTDQKRAMLDSFRDEELNALLTNQPRDAQVHVVPLWHVLPEHLEAYYNSLQPYFTQMIAFRPTGWTFRSSSVSQLPNRSLESIIRAGSADITAAALKPSYESSAITIYGVPYSEHSSFRELALFIASLDIRRIVPTVNVYSEKSRVKMSDLFEKWGQDKTRLLSCKDEGLTSVIRGHW